MKRNTLFDEEFRLEKLTKQNDPLVKLAQHIDFEFFRKELEKYFNKIRPKDEMKGGRPSYDYLMMFKILILQTYYNISDDATEYAILDRLSFIRFLEMGLGDKVPDAKTIWHFKNDLAKEDMATQLFSKLDKQLDKDGIIVNKGKMVDATIVAAPRQRNSREENKKIKEGEVPQEWISKPNKLRQKDIEARWVTHNGQDHFGYKDHVKVDTKTKIITKYEVTSANIHDSEIILNLLEPEDKEQKLHADSAYRSDKIEKSLKRRKIKSRIHEKGYRNRKLTKEQNANNHHKSKTRARIEHVFGFMTNTMNGIYVRCRNLVRARFQIGMKNIVYNMARLVQLDIILTN